MFATQDRERLRPLFVDIPGLHGAIDAVLEGEFGEAFADDASNPRIAKVVLDDFHVVAGDLSAEGARNAVASVPEGDFLVVAEPWEGLMWESGRPMAVYERFLCPAPAEWDRARLAELKAEMPVGFSLERITAESVAEFTALNPTFTSNFSSQARFLERGIGFGLRDTDTGSLVAGCSSYTISSRCVEFEINTHIDYERRGLALVTGAALIEWCVETALEACWDAAHEGSARLAERLGFEAGRGYYAYRME